MHLLLDTSVLSEARGKNKSEEVKQFLRSLPNEVVAIPLPAIFELERGARMLAKSEPERAERFIAWLDRLLATQPYVPPITDEVIRLIARMTTVPRLQRFWRTTKPNDPLRFGCDPAIAAIAIHHRMPIVTRDVGDFMVIHESFPLPGVYDPFLRRWHVPAENEWQFTSGEEIGNCLVFK
ncbi:MULTISPECIES: PIN domain-containing protein [Agrobacterium]|uniref:PIN domain-containing protein n=1 Tax=Agrobacterium tumefaciens TaxID=358 RepID=UPI0015732FD9|nr:type II toxin-antitoxin system VapC family toxin [Agrobacterium tumefaciens]NSZ06337.1 type II toxin-antitoxin system VapC family toxin [Agrobacterium tumefaciens]